MKKLYLEPGDGFDRYVRPQLPRILSAFGRAWDWTAAYHPKHQVTITAHHGRGCGLVGGCCPDPDNLHLTFQPERDGFARALDIDLPVYLAHELVHANQHIKNPNGYGKTIGEMLVSEGVAVRAEFEMSAALGQPMIVDYLQGNENFYQMIEQVRAHLSIPLTEQSCDDFSLHYPRYSLGNSLVEKYRVQQGYPTALDLVSVPAQEILAVTFG